MEVQIFGLENKLNDDVLKLVSRFMGYKVHPTAEILKDRIAYVRLFNPSLSSEMALGEFLKLKERALDILATEAYYKLVKIRSLPRRREAFIKLPIRVKIRMIDDWFRFDLALFNDGNRNNRKFKKEQVEQCPIKMSVWGD
jgi:hypothetical protein